MNINTKRTLKGVTLASLLACSVTLGGCVVAPHAPRIRGDVVVGVAPMPGLFWFDGYWGLWPAQAILGTGPLGTARSLIARVGQQSAVTLCNCVAAETAHTVGWPTYGK